jgi:ATP-binding cassette subfamily B protein
LLEPYLIGRAIDQYISAKQLNGLAPLAITLLVAYIFDNGFQAASAWVMARISQDALRALRRDLFEHLQNLSIAFFDRHTAGELMSRLTNDIDAINQAVSQNVVSLIASVLSLFGILIVMFVLNPYLAISALIVVPIMLWFTNFIARYTRKGFRDLQKELGEINSVMEESISGQRVVKAFRRSETALERFRASNEKVYKAGVYANTYALMLMPLTWVLGNFFIIVLVSLGGYLALKGLATIGMIAAFIGYAQGFLQPLRQLANMYNSIQAALAGAERVFEIMDTPVEVDNASDSPLPAAVRGEVRFTDVSFGYLPETLIIKNMTSRPGQGRTNHRLGGSHRCRQDYHYQPVDPLLRDQFRLHFD